MIHSNARPSKVRPEDKLVYSQGCTCCNVIDISKRKKSKEHLNAARKDLAEIDRKEML